MKAVWYERAGPAGEVLTVGEIDTPSPGPDEVLVRVHVSGVNPSDVKLRAGGRPGVDGIGYDRIVPHSDGAGMIEAVGEGVDGSRVGQRVWLWNGQWQRPFGTCAEYIALPAAQAVPLPDNAGFEAGACMGIPALTAWATLLGDGPVDGMTVLITGGAGAVSHYAIQMAKREGARVLTTISSQEKADYALAAGADHAINYRTEDVAAAVMDLTGGAGVDRIVDLEFGANVAACAEIIKPHGIIVAYGSAAVREPPLPFYTLMFKRVTIRTELVYLLPEAGRRKAEAYLTSALEQGALDHTVAATFPLEETAKAHALIESGGKIGSVQIVL